MSDMADDKFDDGHEYDHDHSHVGGGGRGHDGFLEDLTASLKARAASAPRSADPFGGMREAVGRSRRRRAAGGAAVAVLAASWVGISLAQRYGPDDPSAGGPPKSQQQPTAAGSPDAPDSEPSSGYSAPPTSQPSMLPPAWPFDYPISSSFAASAPTADAMIHAFGKPVSADDRRALLNLVDSFKVCGYPLGSYRFTLLWAGDVPHNGGRGGVLVDVARGGVTFRMGAFNSNKGVYVEPPVRVPAAGVGHPEGDTYAFDEAKQIGYEVVFAAPGSTVTVLKTGASVDIPVGAAGMAEVPSTPGKDLTISVHRPDGTGVSLPVPDPDSRAQRLDAWTLLPAGTSCKSGL
jgi:hypothetical protein